jgi:hypothetical protein
MTVRLTNFGGTDWVDGQILTGSDLTETIQRSIAIIGTNTSGTTVYTGASTVTDRLIMGDTILVSGGATLTLSGARTHLMIARTSITINGDIVGTALGGAGGAPGVGGAAGGQGGSGLVSAGGYGGASTNASAGNWTGSVFNGQFQSGLMTELSYSIDCPQFMYAYNQSYNNFRGGGGGGGKQDSGTATAGSGGGGGIGLILVAPTITISGNITANGNNGTNAGAGTGGAGGGGGGAGGCVFIFAKDKLNLAGGSIILNGGNGGVDINAVGVGNGGAGGFVHSLYGMLSGTSTISVLAGSAGSGGAPVTNGSTMSLSWRGV